MDLHQTFMPDALIFILDLITGFVRYQTLEFRSYTNIMSPLDATHPVSSGTELKIESLPSGPGEI